MKKILCVTVGLFICALSAHSVNADALTQANGAGAPVTVVVNAANVPGAQSIIFNPSSNVVMGGNSVSTSFAITAHHTQAFQKSNGQQYGMASDSNAMWFRDISASNAAIVAVTTNKTGSFTAANNWNSM